MNDGNYKSNRKIVKVEDGDVLHGEHNDWFTRTSQLKELC